MNDSFLKILIQEREQQMLEEMKPIRFSRAARHNNNKLLQNIIRGYRSFLFHRTAHAYERKANGLD